MVLSASGVCVACESLQDEKTEEKSKPVKTSSENTQFIAHVPVPSQKEVHIPVAFIYQIERISKAFNHTKWI